MFLHTKKLNIFIVLGDTATTALLLEAGADQDDNNTFNESLIIRASYNGYDDVVRLLIKYGGDVNSLNDRKYAAIHYAAWRGKTDTVKHLLDAGAIHDEQTRDKNTPLALAAHGGHLDTIKLLLKRGCHVNNADRDGDTPLKYAATNGLVDAVKLLIGHGSNPDMRDHSGASVLWTAIFHVRKEVVKELLLANVKMEVPSRGMDRRHWSDEIFYFYDTPKSPLYVAIDRGSLDIALLLVHCGYDIHKERWLLEREVFDNEEKTEMLQVLLQFVDIPLRLLTICRNYLRRYFGLRLHQCIDKLDLPSSLKKYLVLLDLCRVAE